MARSFTLDSAMGELNVTPDHDCMMVYVKKYRNENIPHLDAKELPSWCFDPDTIWFYFEAGQGEDKASAGERIKAFLMEEIVEQIH